MNNIFCFNIFKFYDMEFLSFNKKYYKKKKRKKKSKLGIYLNEYWYDK